VPTAPSTQLYPEVVDASTLQQRLTAAGIFMPIGYEGQKDVGGTAVVATLYQINRKDEAITLFGTEALSPMTKQIGAILDAGAGPVIAAASGSTSPTLVQRQAVWEKMESDEFIRLRLTDSTTQADLVALGSSCDNASKINNKQFAVMGAAVAQTKANLITLATAIAGSTGEGAKRSVLVGPGVYDSGGTLRNGAHLAACVAAEIAKNSDPSNDLDLWPIPNLTGIERGADGLPIFRRKVVTGAAVNEFEDLLQGGVSPVMPISVPFGTAASLSGVQLTHLRTVFITDTTYDSLMTRIIVDQIFLDVKNYVRDTNYLRSGNTQETRDRIQSGVAALLDERRSWITPVQQPDGTLGYNVAVTPSADMRQVTISYQGTVVRGISTIQVAANLTIPA
jgi:fructose-specific component phosphotransferase system IIB-like protein